MKVRELIEELKKLDQEKDIWVFYDGYEYIPPTPIEVLDEDSKIAKKGDYYI